MYRTLLSPTGGKKGTTGKEPPVLNCKKNVNRNFCFIDYHNCTVLEHAIKITYEFFS